MDAPILTFSLIPAPDDLSVETTAYQSGLEQFEGALLAEGFYVHAHRWASSSIDPGGRLFPAHYLGDFTIKLAATMGPILGTAVGAWLHARYGRKVRLKIGEIEAEAATVEELETLLARAQEIQERNQPKVIHEP